jgi:hypothetical protein
MIDPNLISSYQAKTCECMYMACQKKSANITKNFERAGIAFMFVLFIASIDAQ